VYAVDMVHINCSFGRMHIVVVYCDFNQLLRVIVVVHLLCLPQLLFY